MSAKNSNVRFSLKEDLPFPPAFCFNSFLPYLVRPSIRLISPDPALPFSVLSGKREELRLVGTPIGPNDMAITRHTIATGIILVTNNVLEFEGLSGLVLEDWIR